MTQWPGGSLLPENMGILFAIGGKVKDVAPNATAYVHRGANFIFEMERSWSTLDSPKVVQAQKDWLEAYVHYMQSKYLMPRSYVNFPSRELPKWGGLLRRKSRPAALPQIQIRRREPVQLPAEHPAAGRPGSLQGRKGVKAALA